MATHKDDDDKKHQTQHQQPQHSGAGRPSDKKPDPMGQPPGPSPAPNPESAPGGDEVGLGEEHPNKK
jgi:hypothetical protein